ncbi:MFS transporter [Dermabacteraceae bacterium P13138]
MQLWMRSTFFLFFFSWATFLSYWGLYLSARGFATGEIGMSITVSLITRSLAVVTLFPMLNERLPLLRVARLFCWSSLLLAIAFLPVTGYAGLLVVSALFGLTYPTIMPVLETAATLGAQRGAIVYGPVRMLGSLGFIVGAGANGLVSSYFGNEQLIWVLIGSVALLAVMAQFPLGEDGVANQRSGPTVSSWLPLLRRRDVRYGIGLIVLMQSSHAAYYAFGTLRLEHLGATPQLISIAMMLAPIFEIAVFQMVGSRIERVSLPLLYAVAAAGGVLRWLLWAFSQSVLVLGASQLLHGITFALVQVAFIQFLRARVAPELMSPAQGLYAALGLGVGSAVTTAVAGALMDSSPELAFSLMAAVCLAVIALAPGFAKSLREPAPGAEVN